MNSILTVSAVNTYLSFKLKNDPKIKGIAVSGEISDISFNRMSGHIYFTLTDQKASLKAVMFSSNASKLRFIPEIGLGVIAFGSIDIYERGGIYQLICSQLIPSGLGADYLAFIQLKEQLEKEGIFSKPKKSIPQYPEKIAVVASSDGAAIEDIRSVAARRYPLAKIILFPAAVQGIRAPESIAEALKNADESGSDVIILARGGGSSEDLSCFNAKASVMAVYNCKTPVVSAVGHEIDVSLCDLAADLRAATPSAAAELCTPDIDKLADEILKIKSDISAKAANAVSIYSRAVASAKAFISAFSPENKIKNLEAEIQSYKLSISNMLAGRIKMIETEVIGCRNTISASDPNCLLKKGYALIYKDGELITSSKNLSGQIEIVMNDGKKAAFIPQDS